MKLHGCPTKVRRLFATVLCREKKIRIRQKNFKKIWSSDTVRSGNPSSIERQKLKFLQNSQDMLWCSQLVVWKFTVIQLGMFIMVVMSNSNEVFRKKIVWSINSKLRKINLGKIRQICFSSGKRRIKSELCNFSLFYDNNCV